MRIRKQLAKEMQALIDSWQNYVPGVFDPNLMDAVMIETEHFRRILRLLKAANLPTPTMQYEYECQYCNVQYAGVDIYCCPTCGEDSCKMCRGRCGCPSK